ncbi:hypothetical protein DXG01_001905 [Tephrocybe rancida]|nr:hypothetical protein DXG01_001905 [Tephrocybe rancida]
MERGDYENARDALLTGQGLQWKNHHKKLCSKHLSFTSSNSYQALQNHEKLDALLLAHLVAQGSIPDPSLPNDESLPISTFVSLLPGPNASDKFKLPLPDLKPAVSPQIAKFLYERFSNNNFAIHSHLTTVGHAPKYLFTPAGVTMEIIALRRISEGEEICIPYLDPAMLQTQGFGALPLPPNGSDELSFVARSLREFVGLDQSFAVLPDKPTGTVPQMLHHVFHETYLSNLSETFSKSSHELQYESAMDAGTTLLGAYILIYPPNYPQIGMHLMELAKTAWNMFVSSEGTDSSAAQLSRERAQAFLNMGRGILVIFGQEGDAGGPLSEVASLQSLLTS